MAPIEGVHPILDVTFVDDECIMLAADDPKSLASAIDCCTLELSTTFQLLKLEVKWRAGNTECLVQMVGKLARDIVENWRCDDGSLSIPVPQSDKRINVVDRYRHLGTIVMANGNDVLNARLRAKSANMDRWRRARIIPTQPTALLAMLSVQSGEPPAPPAWVLRVQEDLRFAWKTVALLASAPPPDLEAPFLDWRDEGQGSMGAGGTICAFLRVGPG